ncbi:MAG: permease [Clostridia bacterium]|nr:permease [Clostridia bacterium]
MYIIGSDTKFQRKGCFFVNYLNDLLNAIISSEAFIVFIIAAIGYLIGGIKIKGIEVGTAGVLLVALVFGHFGFTVSKIVETIGIVLFVGSVGLIAGPKFFRNFKKNAKSYVLLGAIIIVSGAATCALIVLISGIDASLAAGLFSGALTSTPGFAAAKQAAGEAGESLVATGYGLAYPFGVIGVVLFVQLLPKILKVDMDKEREQFNAASSVEVKKFTGKLISIDPMGLFQFCLAIALGVVIGSVKIPLPGGATFSLGTSGGPLIAGLVIGHFGRIGRINLSCDKKLLETFREFGLILFLIGAGLKGGQGFVETLSKEGPMLFVYGALMTAIPMFAGYFFARYALKLSLFNNLGAICGGMTSTPALGTLISVTKTDDVATAYAATYPIALVAVVLSCQFIVLFL